jgi:NADH:ubiquinone oxidoreductase subunit F (NADH-binding)
MTSTLTAGLTRRLLGPMPDAPLPRWDLETLVREAAAAGLTGRGGAGFPTATKLRALSGRGGVVVGNAMEGEPLSRKDAVLLDTAPGLVLDGLRLVGAAIGAHRVVLALGPSMPTVDPATTRDVDVRRLRGGFVAGQETALVHQLNGGPPVPRDPLVRVTTRGVDDRPTVVLNAETLAHLALVARHGAAWFGSVGTPEDPGTSLFTVSGAVARPGVVEAARGTRLSDLLATAAPEAFSAVLVGGFHGTWLPAGLADVRLDAPSLAPYGASVGAGVLHVLATGSCPLVAAAEFTTWLAGESAGQCGPCINGLPRLSDSLARLARRVPDPSLPAEIDRLQRLVTGRGACAHPDGTARLVTSTLVVFADHVAEHLAGRCSADGAQ